MNNSSSLQNVVQIRHDHDPAEIRVILGGNLARSEVAYGVLAARGRGAD